MGRPLNHFQKWASQKTSQANDTDLELWMAEIKIRARRRIGEITQGIEKAEGFKGNQSVSNSGVTKQDALLDAGIDKMFASRCEKIAEIPEEIEKQQGARTDIELSNSGVTKSDALKEAMGIGKKVQSRTSTALPTLANVRA